MKTARKGNASQSTHAQLGGTRERKCTIINRIGGRELKRERGGMIGNRYIRGGGLEVKSHTQSVGGGNIFQEKNILIMLVKMDSQLSVSAYPQALHWTAIPQYYSQNSSCNPHLLTIIADSP